MASAEALGFAAAAMEQNIPRRFRVTARCSSIAWRVCPVISNLTGKTGLVLPHDRTVQGIAMWCDVFDLETHDVAATQFAIDCEIEERQIPRSPCKLQPGRMAQTCFGYSGGFGSDQLALVPGSASGRDGADLVSLGGAAAAPILG